MERLFARMTLFLAVSGLGLGAASVAAQDHHIFTVYGDETFINIPKAALAADGEDPMKVTILDAPTWLDLYELQDSFLLSLNSGPNFSGFKRTRGEVFSYHTGAGTAERMVLVRLGNPAYGDYILDDMADGFDDDWGIQSIDPKIMTFNGTHLVMSFDDTSNGLDSRAFAADYDQNGPNAAVVTAAVDVIESDDGDFGVDLPEATSPQAALYTGYDGNGVEVLQMRLEGDGADFQLVAEVFGDACDLAPCVTDPLPLIPEVETRARIELHHNGTDTWLTLTAINLSDPATSVSSTVFAAPGWDGWHGDFEHSFGASEISNFQVDQEFKVDRVLAGTHSASINNSELRIMDNFESCALAPAWDTSQIGNLALVAKLLHGTGCQAEVDMTSPAFTPGPSVLLDTSPTGDQTFGARFRLDTSKLTLKSGQKLQIWGAQSTSGHFVVMLILKRIGYNYALKLKVRDNSGVIHHGAFQYLTETQHDIRIGWEASEEQGEASVWADGVLFSEVTNIDNSGHHLDLTRFGVAAPVANGGILVLDDYVAWP